MRKQNRLKQGMKLFLTTSILLVMISGISACSKSKDVTNEIEDKITPTITQAMEHEVKQDVEQVVDTEPLANTDTKPQEHDAGYYLNSSESVTFQQATWNFAKAYFSADKDQLTKYLAAGVEAEVWEKDVFNHLSRLILKWNPQELDLSKAMDVQYEFMIDGEDSVTYLGMVLEYQDETWVVQTYYLEK